MIGRLWLGRDLLHSRRRRLCRGIKCGKLLGRRFAGLGVVCLWGRFLFGVLFLGPVVTRSVILLEMCRSLAIQEVLMSQRDPR
jgi:hypothetical protein